MRSLEMNDIQVLSRRHLNTEMNQIDYFSWWNQSTGKEIVIVFYTTEIVIVFILQRDTLKMLHNVIFFIFILEGVHEY